MIVSLGDNQNKMKIYFPLIILSILLSSACTSGGNESSSNTIKSHPNPHYHFVDIDTATLDYLETDYAPVYSEIYHRDGTRLFSLTTTLSLRNTSLTDSAYILKISYYDSHGNILKQFLSSSLLLTPLESVEFVVEETDETGGPGANFIINWGATEYSSQLLMQAVMIGTAGQQGISFVTDAKPIESITK